jgi:hypothetical protein
MEAVSSQLKRIYGSASISVKTIHNFTHNHHARATELLKFK